MIIPKFEEFIIDNICDYSKIINQEIFDDILDCLINIKISQSCFFEIKMILLRECQFPRDDIMEIDKRWRSNLVYEENFGENDLYGIFKNLEFRKNSKRKIGIYHI